MFYVRSPAEGGQESIGQALSILWQVGLELEQDLQLIWITWTSLSAIQERPLNLITHSLTRAGPQFSIKISSYQYRKSHCGDKTVVGSSYLHNRISYAGKTSLYWIRPRTSFHCKDHLSDYGDSDLYFDLLWWEKHVRQLFWCWRRNIWALRSMNTMPADALAPKATRASAGMVSTVQDRQHVLLFQS